MREHGERDGIPIVHAPTGALLETLAAHTSGARAVEVGTAIGVSTFHLLRGGAHVTSFEVDRERHDHARGYLTEAGLIDRADLRLQDAGEGLRQLEGPFDLAFIDGPKGGYSEHMELIVERLRPGGLLIVDNVLMSGGVATRTPVENWSQEYVDRMHAFNARLLADERLSAATVLPVGDGVALAARR
jgi:predicted O-methyltransferase YrrM